MTKKTCSIGIDIGGTKMAGVLFSGGKVLSELTLATPKDSLMHFLIMAKAVIEPLEERAKKEKIKIGRIGLGVAGIMDAKKEKILKSPNLPVLDGVKLPAEMKNKLNYEIGMDNDANCFVRAEALSGAARNYRNVFGLAIGTGIGGGWWLDGRLYEGARGAAGEAGHMVVDSENGLDLEAAFHRLTQNNPAQMADEAYRGDSLASKSYEEFGRHLGAVLANIVNLIDPEVIVIGGSVVESGDLFLNAARKYLHEYTVNPEAKKIKILKSKFGPLSGAVGAALLGE